MALPSSGPISMQQIMAEFGRSGATSLSSLYGAASGVPTSGLISLSHFYGKSNGVVVRYYASSLTQGVATVTNFGNASDGNLSSYARIQWTIPDPGHYRVSTSLSGSNAAYSSMYVKRVRAFARFNKTSPMVNYAAFNHVRMVTTGGAVVLNGSAGGSSYSYGQIYELDNTYEITGSVKASQLANSATSFGFDPAGTRLEMGGMNEGIANIYEYFLDVTYSNQP
jgi:hypothetical protein